MGKNQLHPGARWAFRLQTYIISAPFFVLVVFALLNSFFMVSFGWSLLLILVSVLFCIFCIIIIGEIYSRMAYNRWFYEFTDTNLKLERGIIWKRYSNVPYERVQNVDIQRGILARIFGFSTINIQTAGYSVSYGRYGGRVNPEGHIPAIGIEEAEKIRDFLMKKIGKRSSQGL